MQIVAIAVVHVYVRVHMHLCTHTGGQRTMSASVSIALPTNLEGICHLQSLEITDWLEWQAGKPRGPSVSPLHHGYRWLHSLLQGCWGLWTRVLGFAQKPSHSLSSLPSPSIPYCLGNNDKEKVLCRCDFSSECSVWICLTLSLQMWSADCRFHTQIGRWVSYVCEVFVSSSQWFKIMS